MGVLLLLLDGAQKRRIAQWEIDDRILETLHPQRLFFRGRR
jgi:hypothetical protein